ncbi:MAG TPA: ethanolamine ammonia-lyase reactivating factor EutA [Chloroflexota bacterium]|nr:ethanolamine ammonia-lyase reactivating factor EutA [Chloroflexota bacterium]
MIHDHGEDDELTAQELAEVLSENYIYSGDQIELTTVGIDIGSSTSHLIFSKLKLRRLGQQLSSRFVVVSREALYRSPILLTPYRADYTIDAEQLDSFVHESYAAAGLRPDEVDTGAVILTGEAVKRTNARAIADLFATEAGKFVCASAGHNLEAVMAAHGSGAVALSRQESSLVLNVDVGGGTSKLALVRNGEVLETAALAVGGRLVAMDEAGRVARIEGPARTVAKELGIDLHFGEPLSQADQAGLANCLADCLLQAMRREPTSALTQALFVTPRLTSELQQVDAVTFSGGVSEYLYGREEHDFGDLARPLAEAIRQRLPTLAVPLRDPSEHIRATVIGASQFTVQVSGNTISVSRPTLLPLHNLQVVYPRLPEGDELRAGSVQQAIEASLRRFDLQEGAQPVALAIDWNGTPRYGLLRALADGVVQALPRTLERRLPLVLVFHNDFGKLVGHILRDELHVQNDLVSIDNVEVKEFDYIDIGAIIDKARSVPVVVKSLVFPVGYDPRAELLS